MRLYILILCGLLFAPALTFAEPIPESTDCTVQDTNSDVKRSIEDWIEASETDRSGTPSSELQDLRANPNLTCRDVAELNRASYLLDARDHFSETRITSAEHILDHPEQYSAQRRNETILYLISAYKVEKRFEDLIELAKRPVVREQTSTFVASRDALVLSMFAVAGEAHTLDMLRPLADDPINENDWWLMHFASAIAERVGEMELADQFRDKANSTYIPERPLELLDGSEGDLAARMLATATAESAPGFSGWYVRKHPVPDYPRRALERGVTGACDVVFDISVDGKPENVRSYCTSKMFNKEATRAIKRARFGHAEETPTPAKGVVYPLWYSLSR
ncbi:MAG: energy transducer TonB [Pseudomonadota bacterium]